MKNKNILTTILVIALLSIFLIKSTNNNFFKMNSKYKLQSFKLEQDPLKTKIYTLENGLKVFLTLILFACNLLIPFPLTFELGSFVPITTFWIPELIIRSVQGGVFP